MVSHPAMTGKQFSNLLLRLYGPKRTAEQAALALDCSKRKIERLRALDGEQIPKLVALAIAEIRAKRKAPDRDHRAL